MPNVKGKKYPHTKKGKAAAAAAMKKDKKKKKKKGKQCQYEGYNMVVAETLAGIALVKSAVDGIKSAITTANDV